MDGRIVLLNDKFSENLQHHWTVEEMARVVNLSPPHLQKLFRTETGLPPIAFLREKRLEIACELLENSWERISQIGLQVGMPHDSHFTRDFKNKYGITPTEYRKQYWEKIENKMSDGRK